MARAEDILTELKHNSKVKFKETDLFRVYQSIDLVSAFSRNSHSLLLALTQVHFLNPPPFEQGNLKDDSELAAKIPALMKLKRAIYSPEYRSFVEKLAGLEPGTLTDEVRPQGKCRMTRNHPKTQHPNTGRLRRQLPREGMPPALPRRRHRNAQSLLHHLPDRPVPDVDRRGRRTSRTLRRHPRR